MCRARPVLAALFVVAAVLAPSVSTGAPAAEGTFEKVGEFRPFSPQNKLGGTSVFSVVDSARRTWFFATYNDPSTGASGQPRVWTYHLESLQQVGSPLVLAGAGVPSVTVGALDAERGLFFFVYGSSPAWRMGAIQSTPQGPKVVGEWLMQSQLGAEDRLSTLAPAGLRISRGKGYVVAEAPLAKEMALLQFDVARLLAGQDPFDWRYRVQRCRGLSHFNLGTAVGRSELTPVVSLPCKALPGNSDLQGVAVVELGSFTPSNTDGFVERFYPIAGEYGQSESYYDPVTDRMAMRRINPAQLVTFDVRHRRWMRPVVFGQNNMEQSDIDEATGRIYGHGDDPSAGTSREFVYIPELRPTPPQNGLARLLTTPSPGSSSAPKGKLAIDAETRTVYVADIDPPPGSTGPAGLFFHVFRDTRAPLDELRVFDPDNEITNLSAEAQGYGARASYVGGVGGTYSNALNSEYPAGAAVAQGTRHVTFARTLRARLTEGEAGAEAIVSHPEGASDSETKNASQATGEGWPHTSAGCRDFGGKPDSAEDASGGARVACDLDYPRASSTAVYEASTQNPRNAPVQRAATSAVISIHATKGVTTTVTSEGSLDIPGIVGIGSMRATATTFAAGTDGKATSTYEREMRDVSIGGQPFCSYCDPDEVAAELNSRFASLAASGTQVVATVPKPDPTLRGSPGGVQAIVQRDLWDHEEDVGIHDGAEDKWEMPAFVVAIYQDRRYPQHEVYSLAGVQAVSRLPTSLADDLDELASPDPEIVSTAFTPEAVVGAIPASIDDFDVPIGPAGSSLSTPLPTRRPGTRAPGSLRFTERMAWAFASPFRSMPMLAVLAFLAVPVYLAGRRRVLLFHRPSQAGDTDAG